MEENEKKVCDCGCEHDECDCGCEDEVITLVDEEGKEMHFYEVTTLERENKFYACLQDADDEEGGLSFFELVEAPEQDGETYYDFYPVIDEELCNSLYQQLLEEMGEDGCDCDDDCDCDGDHCDCGCHHHED